MFGAMGDLGEEDPIFGQHLRSMRIMGSMNNMMSSLFADPFQQMFQMGSNGFGGFPHLMYPQMQQNRPFGQIMPSMGGSQMNRLLGSGEGFPENAVSYSSSSVYSMNGGQIYQSTSSTKCLGSGVKETKQTVQDSRSGTKKMMVGRHLGERSYIVERGENVLTGAQEENEELINVSDGEEFNKEFQQKARNISNGRSNRVRIEEIGSTPQLAIQAAPPQTQVSEDIYQQNMRNRSISSRRPIRTASSPLTKTNDSPLHISTSVHPHPYNSSRKNRPMKGQYNNNQ